MQSSSGPGPFSLGLGAILGVVVLLLHQAPRSVVTIYAATNGQASQTQIQASSILLPLATSVGTIFLIVYLFYLGVSLHGARRRDSRSSVDQLGVLLASGSRVSTPERVPVLVTAQSEFFP